MNNNSNNNNNNNNNNSFKYALILKALKHFINKYRDLTAEGLRLSATVAHIYSLKQS